jgi:hypothetical protein
MSVFRADWHVASVCIFRAVLICPPLSLAVDILVSGAAPGAVAAGVTVTVVGTFLWVAIHRARRICLTIDDSNRLVVVRNFFLGHHISFGDISRVEVRRSLIGSRPGAPARSRAAMPAINVKHKKLVVVSAAIGRPHDSGPWTSLRALGLSLNIPVDF